MPPVGVQPGAEASWWWKVALHIDEAQIALANAVAHNVDDPRLPQALYDSLRKGQGVLLQILTVKGLLPKASNGRHDTPPPVMSEPAVPEQMITDAEIIDEPPFRSVGGFTERYMAQATAEASQAAAGPAVPVFVTPTGEAPAAVEPGVGVEPVAVVEPAPAVAVEPAAGEPAAAAAAEPDASTVVPAAESEPIVEPVVTAPLPQDKPVSVAADGGRSE